MYAYVYAKMIKNDENQDCLELSPLAHKCDPIKFIPEDIACKIVKEPDFKLWEEMLHKNKKQRLTIFDASNRKNGYIYTYNKHNENYVCVKCSNKKKHVTAKLLPDENGQNYVELGKNEHVCEMQKL
uniref:Uncharacterized protein n=1 Tax=Panagrolaimus sp. ES5 TaxID=591445 RepID=A0AC34FTJ4_9BILA